MHFYTLFFATLVVASYSQSISTDVFEKSLSRQRREFWNDVINEISDDVNGAQSCISAVETFVAENPEVLVVAKRSIAEHILSKRGVVQFFKKWINKLNPIKYFYDCAMFLKNKGAEIYQAIEHPEEVEKEFSEGYKETAQVLSELYKGSLNHMIESVNEVKSHLEHSEGDENSDQKVLYKTITGVLSNLGSYASSFRKEDAEKVFLDTMKVFPHVGNSLSKLNWDILSSLKLTSSPDTVKPYAKNMHHFHLAHNVILIMNNASEFYPKFVAKEYPYGKDLILGVNCVNFLLHTTEFHLLANSLSATGKLKYLEHARKCGTFVTERTTDDQTLEEKSTVLTERFIEAIRHSSQFLHRLEYYLHNAIEKATKEEEEVEIYYLDGEKPVNQLTREGKMVQYNEDDAQKSVEQLKMLRKAVRKIKKFLNNSKSEKTKQFLLKAFNDIVQALGKVETIISEWTLFKNEEEKEDVTFAPGSYFKRLVNLLNQFSVVPNVQTANSFLNVMAYATQDPLLNMIWF